ncbi:MAG: trypsin-like peptidase domain-containing protein [Dehalococcoidales bacterium]|nr:trypsin-like peptidase domain-containing protein [Dehalococcoidales bacterium]
MKNKVRTISIAFLLVVTLAVTLVSGCITIDPVQTVETGNLTATVPAEPINPEWYPVMSVNQTAELPSIADVVALVKPSVVSINTEVPVTGLFGGQTIQQGSGSGWILDEDGIIVTNNHVVEGAIRITVTLDDGRSFTVDSDKVYIDPSTDLAILEIVADNLTALTIGDSSALRVGDWVIAIGNSLGRGTRATVGIVSQLGVSLELGQDQSLYNLIDTSAVINPGNSGGPLVNLAGEVIGITSAKIVATGAEATGFAISTEEAAPIIKELVNKGYVVRPFLGVQGLLTVAQAVANYYRLRVDTGVLVRGIMTGSPAEIAGLKTGDIIVSIDGTEVASLKELTLVLYEAEIGESMEISYWRGDSRATIMIVPIESPPPSFD